MVKNVQKIIQLNANNKKDAARIEALQEKYLHHPDVTIGTQIDLKTGEFTITLSSKEWLAEDMDAVH